MFAIFVNWYKGLFIPWTMKLSKDHFGLQQGKFVRVTMEAEVPKRHIVRPA